MATPFFKTLCGNLSQHPPPEPSTTPTRSNYEVLGGTAVAHHYLEHEAAKHGDNITKIGGLYFTVENRDTITPSLQAKVPLSKELSNKTHHAFILDEMKTGSLLSTDQLYDGDCIAIFSKLNIKILINNKIIITGIRNDHGLWSIPFQSPTSPAPKVPIQSKNPANGVIRLQQKKSR